MRSNPILEVRDVSFSYPDGTQALSGISLSLPKGKKTAFLGPNGAGKTTLFLHFNGILKPDRGKICFSGQDVCYDHISLLELRKKVGVVFQDPDTQLFSASVMQEISFGPLNLGLSREEVWERVKEAMEATDILDLQDKPTHFLSFGQKKLVTVAGVLAMRPEVLVCDEPIAWLDPRHAAQITRLFDKINSRGVTIVFSTHDVDLAYSWADYVFIMKDGMVLAEGMPEQIFSDHQLLEDAEMEKPWLIDVYEELKRKGLASPGAPPRTRQTLLISIPGNGGQVAGQKCQLTSGFRRKGEGFLRRGYTTGTCAAAAAQAAVLALLGREVGTVVVKLPGGRLAELPVAGLERSGEEATAWVVKDAGDDPDVTNGARIQATVRLRPGEIIVRGGSGVGTVTKPGLAVSPGQPAINPVPLAMIKESVAALLPFGQGAEVTIGVPGGENLARRTMNPQLGIVGGISILGTTGIVEPMSKEAFKQALAPQLEVARAVGYRTVVLTPGRRGKTLAGRLLGVPSDAVAQMGNFVGFMLEECVRLGFREVVFWGHVGKVAKIAAGSFDTHNRVSDGRAEAVAALAATLGAEPPLVREILDCPTVEGMVALLREVGLEEVWNDLAARISQRAIAYTRDALEVGTVLFSSKGDFLGWDTSAFQILQEAGWLGLLAGF